jgi:membrane-associated phospholipid phosphatase
LSTAKKIPRLFCNLIVFVAYYGTAYPQNFQVVDSVDAQSVLSSKTEQNIINHQEPLHNFYKSDSIFSFRSPKGYVPSLRYNFGEQATAPFRFKTKQWLITGAAIGITTSLIILDTDIDDWARTQKQKHNWVNKFSPFITEFGGKYGVYSVFATGLLSAAFKNEKGVQTSLMATQAMITSGVWVLLIKQITGRERPKASYIFSQLEGGKWHGPFAKYIEEFADDRCRFSYDAFPSGHTATAFSIATVFASQYNDTRAIPILSFSVASLVGISRLTEHEHWSSDVFVGALIGYLCGKQVVGHFNKTHQNSLTSTSLRSKNKTELTFIQDGNQIGLLIKW